MEILKPTIRGLKPFASGATSATWLWADATATWADADFMWAAQLEAGETPILGDIRINTAIVGDIKVDTPTIK